MLSNCFPKNDRLCGSLEIKSLFLKGDKMYEYPFQVLWKENYNSQSPLKIAISIPKKKVSNASKRNHIKRLIREAYRKKKFVLVEKLLKKNKSMNLMLIYTLPSILSFTEIEDKISLTLQRLVEEI